MVGCEVHRAKNLLVTYVVTANLNEIDRIVFNYFENNPVGAPINGISKFTKLYSARKAQK